MSKTPIGTIGEHFSKVSNPRIERTKRHKLLDVICIARRMLKLHPKFFIEGNWFSTSELTWFNVSIFFWMGDFRDIYALRVTCPAFLQN